MKQGESADADSSQLESVSSGWTVDSASVSSISRGYETSAVRSRTAWSIAIERFLDWTAVGATVSFFRLRNLSRGFVAEHRRWEKRWEKTETGQARSNPLKMSLVIFGLKVLFLAFYFKDIFLLISRLVFDEDRVLVEWTKKKYQRYKIQDNHQSSYNVFNQTAIDEETTISFFRHRTFDQNIITLRKI